MKDIDPDLHDEFRLHPEQPREWYKNQVLQTLVAILVFVAITSVIGGLTIMFAQRLFAYYAMNKVITINVTNRMLMASATHIKTMSNLLPIEDRNRSLELSQNLEQAAKELKGPQHFALYYEQKSAPKWLKVVMDENTRQYRRNSRYNDRILEYVSTVDYNVLYKPPEGPIYWSSHLLNWTLRKVKKTGTKNADPRSWLDWGVKLTEPKLGAIAVFGMRNQKNFAYVGCFLLETTNYVVVIAGDIGGAVNIAAFDKRDLLGYRWLEIKM